MHSKVKSRLSLTHLTVQPLSTVILIGLALAGACLTCCCMFLVSTCTVIVRVLSNFCVWCVNQIDAKELEKERRIEEALKRIEQLNVTRSDSPEV